MNFIVLVSDTFRRDNLGCYGDSRISTPNIDRFAEKAIIFDNAYVGSFPTVPHRHDLVTGRYTFTYSKWAPLPRDEKVLAGELGRAGYMTMMIADCPHILENGFHFDRGFEGWEWIRGQESDRWRTSPRDPEYSCPTEKLRYGGVRFHQRTISWWRYEEDTFVARTMSAACRWLERNYGEHEKFFLYVDTFDPHEPWDAPEWYTKMYADPDYDGDVIRYPVNGPSDYLTEEENQHCRALYAAEVTLVDRWVGRLLERIEDMGLMKDTVVIFTSDHGYYIGEHDLIGKAIITPEELVWVPLYPEVARIPFLVYAPGVGPRHESAFIQPADIMPTLLDLARAEPCETTQGISLVPLLRGEAMQTRDMAVTSPSIIHHGVGGTRITVTTDEWTFICAPSKLPDAAGEDRSVDGSTHHLGRHRFDSELYHNPSDPTCTSDVIVEHPAVATELRQRLVRFLEEVNTPEEYIGNWR
jgi:arylsulfatase A-like enzyme